jgi:hypothetical protein
MTGWAYPPEPSREPERLGLADFLAVLALPWLDLRNGPVTGGPPGPEQDGEVTDDSKEGRD